MQFRGSFKFNILILFCIMFQFGAFCSVRAASAGDIDAIRADLACFKNKNSQEYIKTKQKLEKLIIQNKINYSNSARLKDIDRLIKEQKYNSAIYELTDLIEHGVETSKCYEILGDICLKTSKNSKNTAQYYRNALSADYNNTSAYLKLAKLYFIERKNTIGIELLSQLVDNTNNQALLEEIENIIQNQIMPKDRLEANNLYEILGRIYAKLNKKAESYSAFDRALQLNPNDIYLKYYFGDMLYENNQNNGAIIVYDSILNENPYESQIRASKAKTLIKDGNYLSANKEFLTILDQYPESNQAKYGIFKIYENKIPADKILERINANNPDYKASERDFVNFAKLLDEIGDYKGAQIFKTYIQNLEKEKQRRIQKELNDKKREQKPTIKEKFIQKTQKPKKQETKKQEPKKQEPAKKPQQTTPERKKEIVKDIKQHSEYQDALEKYLSIENKDASIYVAIANTYKLMDDPKTAIEYYKEALKLAPCDSDINYSLGLTFLELNSAKTAKTYLEQAIKFDDKNVKAINLLSFVNQKIITEYINTAYGDFENKNYIEAFELLNGAIKEYPTNAQLYYYRALVCDAINRNAAQIMDLQKAIELDPGYYMSYYQLGLAYEKIKDERSALVAYEKFLSTEPEEKELIREVQRKVMELGAKYY